MNKEKRIEEEKDIGYNSKEWLENMYFIIGRKITRTEWEQLLVLVEQKCRHRVKEAISLQDN